MCETSTNACIYRKNKWKKSCSPGILQGITQKCPSGLLVSSGHASRWRTHWSCSVNPTNSQVMAMDRQPKQMVRWTSAHKCPQHERKGRVKLLPVHRLGAGGDVGRWQHLVWCSCPQGSSAAGWSPCCASGSGPDHRCWVGHQGTAKGKQVSHAGEVSPRVGGAALDHPLCPGNEGGTKKSALPAGREMAPWMTSTWTQ